MDALFFSSLFASIWPQDGRETLSFFFYKSQTVTRVRERDRERKPRVNPRLVSGPGDVKRSLQRVKAFGCRSCESAPVTPPGTPSPAPLPGRKRESIT